MITSDLESRPSISSKSASTKINHKHLSRLAIVYVRQSTQQQVLENRESRARQSMMVDIMSWDVWTNFTVGPNGIKPIARNINRNTSATNAISGEAKNNMIDTTSCKHVPILAIISTIL